jgi:hypothetical protein
MKCKKCGKLNDPEAVFCEQCGASLKTQVCTKCGKTNDPDGQFCMHCGASLRIQTCPRCGKENKPGSQFCKYCGQALDQPVPMPVATHPVEEVSPAPVPVSNPRRGMPAWGWVLTGLAALSIVLVLVFLLGPKALTGPVPPNPPEQAGPPTSVMMPASSSTRQPATIKTSTRIATEIFYPVPAILQQSLLNPKINNLETFDHWTGKDWFYITDNVSVVSDGGSVLHLPGTPGWGTVAASPAFRQGQGALTRLKLSGSSFNIEFHLIQNEWNTPAYKRFGGLLCCETNTMKTAIQEGTDTHLYDQAMGGSLVFNPNRWYGLFIGSDKKGGFRFLAWDWEDAGKYAWYDHQGGNAWAGGEWILEVPVDTGTVFLDDFSIVSFDGFGSFPSTSTTKTPTPKPLLPHSTGAVTVSVSMDTNCRTGPGEPFSSIGSLMIGETAEVVGRSPNWDFWIIKNPDDPGTCWLWAQHATVIGDTSKLPIIQPPATPTPTPKPITGILLVTPNPCPFHGTWGLSLKDFPAGITVEVHFSKKVQDDWVPYGQPYPFLINSNGTSGQGFQNDNEEDQPVQMLAEAFYNGSSIASAVFILEGK